MLVETLADRAVVPVWEAKDRDVWIILTDRRLGKPRHAQLALQARLVEVGAGYLPLVNSGDHEGLVAHGDDGTYAVGGDQLTAPDLAFRSCHFNRPSRDWT
jgi:hypothetical protein